MHVEKLERTIGELISQISRSEIKLPELQRDFVWKPTQVAKLVDSLYRGYPSGSLLLWETDEEPGTREMEIGEVPSKSWRAPLYLIDGQQRLTSLYRVFTGHPDAQIVFQVDLQQFKNESAATRNDPKWLKVKDVLDPNVGLIKLLRHLQESGCASDEVDIERRLQRLQGLRNHHFHLEILRGFVHQDMAEIFVRVNSGGRHLDTLDLAMATLSADWPGVVERLQTEAEYWRKKGFSDIDVNFLSRALVGAALGRGLGAFKPGKVSEEKLNRGWETVKTGLRRVIPLLKSHLRIERSDVLPSVLALIPLVVLLGERPSGRMDRETTNSVIYWFLVATIRSRYSGSSDTKLTQDIRAARRPKATEALLKNLDILQSRPHVTPASLEGRTKESPYFLLSLLVTQMNGARDWWYGTELLGGSDGELKLEHHHVHPVATLDGKYDKAEINDIANLIFISGKANRRIGYKSPRLYFPELGNEELGAHYVPLDEALRDADRYGDFLAERRRLLAAAMTSLLDKFRPAWLDALPTGPASTTEGMSLGLVLYASAWDSGRLVFSANVNGAKWKGSASMADLERAVNDAAVVGIPSDVEIANESVPVEVVEESVEVPVGPFVLTGTAEEWMQVFDRERNSARSLASYAPSAEVPWNSPRVRFPITSTD